MGKASNQKKKRRQGTGASRTDLEGQRALEQLARAAQKLSNMFETRKEHLAAVSRSWWRGAEPEAAEVPDWTEGSAASSAAGSHPARQLFGQATPGPGTSLRPGTTTDTPSKPASKKTRP